MASKRSWANGPAEVLGQLSPDAVRPGLLFAHASRNQELTHLDEAASAAAEIFWLLPEKHQHELVWRLLRHYAPSTSGIGSMEPARKVEAYSGGEPPSILKPANNRIANAPRQMIEMMTPKGQEWVERVLNRSLNLGSGRIVLLRDATTDDLKAEARDNRKIAAANTSAAERHEKLVAFLEEHKVRRISDLKTRELQIQAAACERND